MALPTATFSQSSQRILLSLRTLGALLVISMLSLFAGTPHLAAQETRTPPEEALKSRTRIYRQSADELDRFGFDKKVDQLSKRQKRQLERYRQRQRAIGFERSGRNVDVSAGYEATEENSPRR